MSLVHGSFEPYLAVDNQSHQQLSLDGITPAARPARSSRRNRAEVRVVPEASGRFQRVCPYCHQSVFWRYIGRATATSFDPKSERPFCHEHGPLRLWRCLDVERALVYAVGHLSEIIGTRYLKDPCPVTLAHPASPRWKRPRTVEDDPDLRRSQSLARRRALGRAA